MDIFLYRCVATEALKVRSIIKKFLESMKGVIFNCFISSNIILYFIHFRCQLINFLFIITGLHRYLPQNQGSHQKMLRIQIQHLQMYNFHEQLEKHSVLTQIE